jgi:hypothetical protein
MQTGILRRAMAQNGVSVTETSPRRSGLTLMMYREESLRVGLPMRQNGRAVGGLTRGTKVDGRSTRYRQWRQS